MADKANERFQNRRGNSPPLFELELGWHELAEEMGDLEPEEWQAFKDSIQATNGPEHDGFYRIVEGNKQGLDGRLRWQACEELGLPPPSMILVNLPEENQVVDFILRRQFHRRPTTPALRQKMARKLHDLGLSQRAIAKKLMVAKATIETDLANQITHLTTCTSIGTPDTSGDSKEVVKTAKVPPQAQSQTGQDRQATHSVGQDGKRYRRRPRKARVQALQPGDLEEIKDELGETVAEEYREIFKAREQFTEALGYARKATAILEYLITTKAGAWIHQQSILIAAKQIEKEINFYKPYCLCIQCKGRKKIGQGHCPTCAGRGFLTQAVATKARRDKT